MQESETDKYRSLRQIGIKKTTKVGDRLVMGNPKKVSSRRSVDKNKSGGCSGCSRRRGNR